MNIPQTAVPAIPVIRFLQGWAVTRWIPYLDISGRSAPCKCHRKKLWRKALMTIGDIISQMYRMFKRRIVKHRRPPLPWGYTVPRRELCRTLKYDSYFEILSARVRAAGKSKDIDSIVQISERMFRQTEITSRKLFLIRAQKKMKWIKTVFRSCIFIGLVSAICGFKSGMVASMSVSLFVIVLVSAINWRIKSIFRDLKRTEDRRIRDFIYSNLRGYDIHNVRIIVKNRE